MKTLVILACVIMMSCYACKKENNAKNDPSPEATSEIIATSDDGEDISKTYDANNTNEFSEYSFSGVAGTYFGYTSTFEIGGKARIDITFGTILTTAPALSEKDIMSLIAPGEKIYGSLGAYTFDPQLNPNRVEIAYMDKKGKRWCSTTITERETSSGTETDVKISQPGSEFSVDKIKKVTVAGGDGYRVSGHFKCFLYEVNGHAKKKIKGSFSGVISTRV